MTKKTLIFGGAGFIGSNLVQELAAKPETVYVFDNLSMGNQIPTGLDYQLNVGDMTDYTAMAEVIREVNPDKIYHLAANSDISNSSVNPTLDLDNTLISTVNLCAVLRDCVWRGDSLVFASSSAVYKESEEELAEESPTVPMSSYGWMKLASERVIQNYAADSKLTKTLIARFPNVTGANQTHGVVHDLVKKLKRDPTSLTVLGDGSQEKPYMLAAELVASLEHVLSCQWGGTLVANFGPSSTTTVRQIVSTIVEVSGLTPLIKFGNTKFGWVGDVPKYRLDTELVRSQYGLDSFLSSDDAIRESVRWAWENL